MNSFLRLGVILILVLQVYGRPSNLRSNRLADYLAYNIVKRVYQPRAFDDTDTREGDKVDTGRDDSLSEEKAIPSEHRQESHSSNNQIIYNEDRGLGLNENDDNSVEGYETPFQNHQEAQANNDRNDLRDVFTKRGRPRIPCTYCCSYERCAADFDHICLCY